jgi:glycosyltransferase involved in cell wall biosynthesis
VRFAFGSSPGPVRELSAAGFRDPQLLPVCVDPREWDGEDDRPLAKALQDGCTNLVYAGPFTALEHLNQLLTSFLHYLTLDRESRLVLVRQGAVDESVYARLYAEVRSLDLVDHVLVARDVTVAQLQSVYRTAHLFWSLDESESFGENFLQAMWFDVPIVAYRTEIARELAGDAGLLINDKSDLLAVAALIQIVAGDARLRAAVIAAQRRTRERCDEARTLAALLAAPALRREPADAPEASTPWPS